MLPICDPSFIGRWAFSAELHRGCHTGSQDFASPTGQRHASERGRTRKTCSESSSRSTQSTGTSRPAAPQRNAESCGCFTVPISKPLSTCQTGAHVTSTKVPRFPCVHSPWSPCLLKGWPHQVRCVQALFPLVLDASGVLYDDGGENAQVYRRPATWLCPQATHSRCS